MEVLTAGRLAALLAYPDAGFFSTLAACRGGAGALAGLKPCAARSNGLRSPSGLPAGAPVASAIERFAREIDGLPLRRLQELYVSAFDLDPACTLEIGWHLFGDTYERGAFLAALREDLHQHAIEEGGELPDHLTSVLALAERLDPARAAALRRTIQPAVEKLHAALAARANPYAHLIDGIISAAHGGD